jgi:transketolase
MDAATSLETKGKKIRVVSMPCTDVFDAQDQAYRESVLPSAVRARVAVEAGVTDYWRKYVGLDGKVVGIDRFGESAPAKDLFKYFGFTPENVVKAVEEVL